jgi:outer membrane lipoprotein carrier protein
MKKTLFIYIILNITFLSFAQAQDPKAKAVLDAVKLKYQGMDAFRAYFIHNMSSPSTGVNETFQGDITVKGAKFYLQLAKQHVITDGKTQWTYLKDPNEVNITEYEPDKDEITPNKIYTIYETDYEYVYVEEKLEQGKAYHIIDLKPKNRDAQFFKIRLKITKGGNSIKSWEIFERNSNRYLYTITKFAKVSVGDSYFKYNTANYPSKPEVIDMRMP